MKMVGTRFVHLVEGSNPKDVFAATVYFASIYSVFKGHTLTMSMGARTTPRRGAVSPQLAHIYIISYTPDRWNTDYINPSVRSLA